MLCAAFLFFFCFLLCPASATGQEKEKEKGKEAKAAEQRRGNDARMRYVLTCSLSVLSLSICRCFPSIHGLMIQVDDPDSEADYSQGGLFTLMSNLAEQCKRQPLTSVHYRGNAYSCPLTRCADGELASLQSLTLDLLPPPSEQGLQLQLKDPASHFARLCSIAASSPVLTSLEVHFHAQAAEGSMLRSVALACGKLRRLNLSGCSAEDLAQWQERIQTLQPPSSLRELRLSRILRGVEICAEEIPRGADRGLFNHLPHLDTLQLERCDCPRIWWSKQSPCLRCAGCDSTSTHSIRGSPAA